jgi:hypothetical protein
MSDGSLMISCLRLITRSWHWCRLPASGSAGSEHHPAVTGAGRLAGRPIAAGVPCRHALPHCSTALPSSKPQDVDVVLDDLAVGRRNAHQVASMSASALDHCATRRSLISPTGRTRGATGRPILCHTAHRVPVKVFGLVCKRSECDRRDSHQHPSWLRPAARPSVGCQRSICEQGPGLLPPFQAGIEPS